MIQNVKPAKKFTSRTFSPVTLHKKLQIPNNHFFKSDFTDTEYIELCGLLGAKRYSYATLRDEVGKTVAPFGTRFKPNVYLQSEQHTKVPFHYRKKPSSLSDDLKQNSLINQFSFTPEKTPAWGITFLNTLFFSEKLSIKVCFGCLTSEFKH